MAIRSREEIINLVTTRLGDSVDDDSLSLIEDVTDTFSDLESKVNGDGEDWKSKYEENDTMWRNKYRDRFTSGDPSKPIVEKPQEKLETEEIETFEDLFETK